LAESGDQPYDDDADENRAESFGVNNSNGNDQSNESETNTQDIFLRDGESFIEDTDIVGESIEDSSDGIAIKEFRRVSDDSFQHFVVKILGGIQNNISIEDAL